MNKQTAIEWLQDQFRAFGTIAGDDENTHQLIKSAIDMCERAKLMEREQMIRFAEDYEQYVYNKSQNNRYVSPKTPDQYYNETFNK